MSAQRPTAKLGGEVLAVADDGSCVVARGASIDLYPPGLSAPTQLPVATDSEDARYAVSSGARYFALVDGSGEVDLWSVPDRKRVARLRPPKSDELHEPLSWGPPRFLGQETLVTLHDDSVVVWNVPHAKVELVLHDEAISLARDVFAFGNDSVMIRSGSSSLGIANVALVELSIRDGSVRHRRLAPHRDRVALASASETDRVVFTHECMRVETDIEDGARVTQLNVSDVPIEPDALHVAQEARIVVWAGTTEDEHDTRVGVVLLEDHRAYTLARLPPSACRIVHVRLHDGTVHALDGCGNAYAWLLPSPEAYRTVASTGLNRSDLARENAIVHIGIGDLRAGLAALTEADLSDVENRLLVRYIEMVLGNHPSAWFAERLKREGVLLLGEDTTLALATRLSSAECVEGAALLFGYWLLGSKPKRRSDEGARVGLDIVSLLNEAEIDELPGTLLRMLSEKYPRDTDVRRALEAQAFIEGDIDDE